MTLKVGMRSTLLKKALLTELLQILAAPSGMDFVSSDKYPGLKDDLLVGWLSFQYLHRCDVEEGEIVKQEGYFKGIGRVRVIRQGPSGYIYFGLEGKGIMRLVNNF